MTLLRAKAAAEPWRRIEAKSRRCIVRMMQRFLVAGVLPRADDSLPFFSCSRCFFAQVMHDAVSSLDRMPNLESGTMLGQAAEQVMVVLA